MIESLIYGLIGGGFAIGLTRGSVALFQKWNQYAFGFAYGSLAIKMAVLCGLTIAIKPYIQNKIIYAFCILGAIIYSLVYLLLQLTKK